jgi:hypothetical protein
MEHPMHWCESADGRVMRALLAPCVEPDCDFCADGEANFPYYFLPAARWCPDPETGRDWQKIVLALSKEGQHELTELHEQHGYTRGMIVHVSRSGRRTSGRMEVKFCQNGNRVLTMDAFDVRPVVQQQWARWLRDAPPEYVQQFLPFPDQFEVEKKAAAAGGAS